MSSNKLEYLTHGTCMKLHEKKIPNLKKNLKETQMCLFESHKLFDLLTSFEGQRKYHKFILDNLKADLQKEQEEQKEQK
jgi:hypothetical protein